MSGLMKVLGWTLVATLMLLIAAPSSVNAQERMTVEQWTAKMQQLRSQESGLKKDMADCDKALAALKGDQTLSELSQRYGINSHLS